MGKQASEEIIAELANPALKSIYKGKDAFSEYGDPEYWKGVGHAGKVGFFTSVAHGGTTGYIMRQSGAYADAQSVLEELDALEERADKMDMDTFAQAEEKYNRSRKQNYQVLERVLQNASAKQRADIIKRYRLSDMFAEDGSMQADFAKQLDTGTEAKYNKRYYNRVMRNNEDLIESDLERLNDDLAAKYGEETQTMSVFDGELSEKGRIAASKVKQLIKIASEKSGKAIGFVITDGNVPQFRGVNAGDRIYMSADTFEKGDAYEVAVEETMHFAEGSEEHNALVKLLAEDGDLEARAVDEVLGADGYGFDGETIRDIGRRIEAGAVVEGESITAEELRYSQKYFKFLHKNFPGERESQGSDAHKWATLWAARQDVKVGDQALAYFNGHWYLIERFNDADSGYQVEAFVYAADYRKIAKEIKEYGRSGKIREVQGLAGSTDRIDLINKRSYSLGREGAGIDRDETQYVGENRQVQRMGEGTDEGRERSGRDSGGDRESGGADRQGDPVTVTREEWLAYEEYRSEVGAHMGAELLGNGAFIDKIIRENGSLGEKILGKIIAFKEALGRIGDPEAQAQHKRLVEAEKLYLDAIEAAGKKYVNGKIVSAIDDEEKENTAEGGGKYSLEEQDSESGYTEYDKRIELSDVKKIQAITAKRGQVSINNLTQEELATVQKWAHKYWNDPKIRTKSPFFRAWFGEWRAHQTKDDISIATIPEYIGTNEARKKNRGTVVNGDTGWEIRISREGESNTISHAGDLRMSELGLAGIQELIQNAYLFDTELHEHHRNNAKDDRIALDHKLYALGKDLQGGLGLYRITVEETYQSYTQPQDMRFHNLKYIEKVADNIGSLTYDQSHSAESTSDASTTAYSISDLYGFVKQFDKEFTAAPEVSELVLNDDGTPKVFYHGTRTKFSAFELQDKPTFGRALGDGFYFTSSYEKAFQFANGRFSKGQDRGGIIMPVYLCMKNPYVIEADADRTKWAKEYHKGEYDGIIDLKNDTYYVEGQTQIKSAEEPGTQDANIGTFDGRKPDLRYSLKDDGAGIEDWMRNGMESDSQTSANPAEVDTDGQTEVDIQTEGSAVTKRPTSYTREEARAMVDRILEISSFEGTRAKLAGGNLSDMIKRAHALLNSAEAGKRAGVALNFADYVIDHAILVDEIDPWEAAPYIETVDLLKPYLHRLNLEGLQEEIRHHYDKDTSVYGRWGKRKGEIGISIENAAAELAERGYHVSHTNPADILFEMDRDYRDAAHMLRKGANSTVKEVITAEERKVLRQKIVKAILNSFDNRDFSRATLTKIANRSLDDVERLKVENQRLAREKRKLESERDRAVANKNSAEERLEKETLQRKEAETFDQVKNRVLKAVRGIANWKKGVFESAAEANGDALKGVIGQLSRIENKGNVSATGTRKAMKAIADWYARPDKHPMVKELQESKLYDEGILDLMNEIGDDGKIEKNMKLTAAELANVELVVRHFKHIVENYHRVFREGKYVEARPLSETLDMGEWRGVLRHGTYTASVQKAFAMLNSAENLKIHIILAIPYTVLKTIQKGIAMILYTVKNGDSIYKIAREYGTTAERIIADNGLTDPSTLAVGQTLVILQPLVSYRVRSGDTVYSVSRQFGISLNQLYRNNPVLMGGDTLTVGQPLNIVLPQPIYDREVDVNGYVYPNVNRDILRQTLPYLTYITVFTYGIDEEGELIDVDDEEIIELARQYGVAPIMQISSITRRGTFSSETAARLFSDEALQDRIIEEIVTVLDEKRYEGVDVDFEYVEAQYAEAYVRFVEKLRARLSPLGYEVFVALAPKYNAEQEGLLYEGHDYAGLGNAADGVLLMTYEWGYSLGEPQAVSPIDKVRRVVDYGVTAIPPEKIFLGVPNYGYDWPLPYVAGQTRARSLSNTEAVALAKERNAEILFDEVAQSPNFNYFVRENGAPVEHVVWFEDARSVAAMLGLVEEYGLRGFAIWNLMRYFPQLFLVLNGTFRIRRGLE